MSQSQLIATFYHFVALPDYQALQPVYLQECRTRGLKGSILLASEGLNATLAGNRDQLLDFLEYLQRDPRFAALTWKESLHHTAPFGRMKVRLKQEIVAMRVPAIDPDRHCGTYVAPKDWDNLINRDDVVVIDTRNDYEVRLGTFTGAINPQTTTFRELPAWLDTHIPKDKAVAMFCTGGIRCEKSTAYLKQHGFSEVYHLEGGILNYLEHTGNQSQAWQGACFVFDDRVAVDDQLQALERVPCSQCGAALSTDSLKGSAKGAQFVCRTCATHADAVQAA